MPKLDLPPPPRRLPPVFNPTPLLANLWIPKIVEAATVDGVDRRAVFNEEAPARTHRYLLSLLWDATRPPLVVIMCNPSTADHHANDPTVARMVGYARRWEHGGLVVLNVFALRSTDPAGVVASPDPLGRWNYVVINTVLIDLQKLYGARLLVLLAWGALAERLCADTGVPAVRTITRGLARHAIKPHCLQITRAGAPGHPLYLPGRLRPRPYPLKDEQC